MIIDGAINWGTAGPRPAAHDFDVQARSKSIYEWVRQVRGGVLAGAFTVERHISVAIVHFMLGERTAISTVQEAFEEGLLGPLSFERRINVMMLIAPNFLDADEIASLKVDLSELRTLRNVMAHKPFWFQPELNEDNEIVNLVPVIQRGKTSLCLTTDFVEHVNKLIAILIEKVVVLAKKCASSSERRA